MTMAHRATYNATTSDPNCQVVQDYVESTFYTQAMMRKSLHHMITSLMPNHVLHCTKRYLCCKCHKPANIKVCMSYTHLSNLILNELHCLPPYGNNQSLSSDEVVNILLFATPNNWQVKMEE